MSHTSTIRLHEIANSLQAYQHCVKHNIQSPQHNHMEFIKKCEAILPSGAGFDRPSKFILDKCSENKIVFKVHFHRTEHIVKLTPSFILGYDVQISGIDFCEIKDYIANMVSDIFEQ